jgi:hypothetical protein
MRQLLLPVFVVISCFPAKSQVETDCSPVELQKLDSVINYVREGQTFTYTPVEVFIYQFDGESQYPVIDKLTLPSREPVNRQNYFFSPLSLKTHYILQEWNGDEFYDRSRTDYTYRPDSRIEKEVFSGYDGSAWVPYQQHIYNYDEQNIVRTYLRQMMYSPGVWTDFSYKNYIYDSRNRLIERNEQRIADGVIFWVELFTYDIYNRVASRVRQSLKYNPETRSYALVNLNRQRYTYDKFGELSYYLVDTWTNGSWVLSGKSVYFRSFLYDKEVPVCYMNRTFIVTVRAALRLLNYGAVLGSCECLDECRKPDESDRGGDIRSRRDGGITVYPNPASSAVKVRLQDDSAVYSDISIYDQNGRLVQRNPAAGLQESIDVSGLADGTYFLVISGAGESMMTSFIKAK